MARLWWVTSATASKAAALVAVVVGLTNWLGPKDQPTALEELDSGEGIV